MGSFNSASRSDSKKLSQSWSSYCAGPTNQLESFIRCQPVTGMNGCGLSPQLQPNAKARQEATSFSLSGLQIIDELIKWGCPFVLKPRQVELISSEQPYRLAENSNQASLTTNINCLIPSRNEHLHWSIDGLGTSSGWEVVGDIAKLKEQKAVFLHLTFDVPSITLKSLRQLRKLAETPFSEQQILTIMWCCSAILSQSQSESKGQSLSSHGRSLFEKYPFKLQHCSIYIDANGMPLLPHPQLIHMELYPQVHQEYCKGLPERYRYCSPQYITMLNKNHCLLGQLMKNSTKRQQSPSISPHSLLECQISSCQVFALAIICLQLYHLQSIDVYKVANPSNSISKDDNYSFIALSDNSQLSLKGLIQGIFSDYKPLDYLAESIRNHVERVQYPILRRLLLKMIRPKSAVTKQLERILMTKVVSEIEQQFDIISAKTESKERQHFITSSLNKQQFGLFNHQTKLTYNNLSNSNYLSSIPNHASGTYLPNNSTLSSTATYITNSFIVPIENVQNDFKVNRNSDNSTNNHCIKLTPNKPLPTPIPTLSMKKPQQPFNYNNNMYNSPLKSINNNPTIISPQLFLSSAVTYKKSQFINSPRKMTQIVPKRQFHDLGSSLKKYVTKNVALPLKQGHKNLKSDGVINTQTYYASHLNKSCTPSKQKGIDSIVESPRTNLRVDQQLLAFPKIKPSPPKLPLDSKYEPNYIVTPTPPPFPHLTPPPEHTNFSLNMESIAQQTSRQNSISLNGNAKQYATNAHSYAYEDDEMDIGTQPDDRGDHYQDNHSQQNYQINQYNSQKNGTNYNYDRNFIDVGYNKHLKSSQPKNDITVLNSKTYNNCTFDANPNRTLINQPPYKQQLYKQSDMQYEFQHQTNYNTTTEISQLQTLKYLSIDRIEDNYSDLIRQDTFLIERNQQVSKESGSIHNNNGNGSRGNDNSENGSNKNSNENSSENNSNRNSNIGNHSMNNNCSNQNRPLQQSLPASSPIDGLACVEMVTSTEYPQNESSKARLIQTNDNNLNGLLYRLQTFNHNHVVQQDWDNKTIQFITTMKPKSIQKY